MALNVKILYPLDHPPVTFPNDEPAELSASGGELDTAKENLHKSHLSEKEKDFLYRESLPCSLAVKLNVLN